MSTEKDVRELVIVSEIAQLVGRAFTIYDKTTGEASGLDSQAILNYVDDEITKIINLGALYKGVAIPSTDPESPDGSVFYIASTQGTYADFGGFVLDGGFAVLSNISGTWTGTKFLKTEMDAKAAHGYDSSPKTLKQVDDDKAAHGYIGAETVKTLKEVDDSLVQLAGEVNEKIDKTSITNELGDSEELVVSQKGVSDKIKTPVETTEEVAAQSLVELKERIDALEELIKQGILNNIIIKTLSVEYFQMNGASLILTGANAPAVTPDFIGQFYIKTTATTACYQSTGTTAVGDWKQIG